MNRFVRPLIWCWSKVMSQFHVMVDTAIDKAARLASEKNTNIWKMNLLKALRLLKRLNGENGNDDKAG